MQRRVASFWKLFQVPNHQTFLAFHALPTINYILSHSVDWIVKTMAIVSLENLALNLALNFTPQ